MRNVNPGSRRTSGWRIDDFQKPPCGSIVKSVEFFDLMFDDCFGNVCIKPEKVTNESWFDSFRPAAWVCIAPPDQPLAPRLPEGASRSGRPAPLEPLCRGRHRQRRFLHPERISSSNRDVVISRAPKFLANPASRAAVSTRWTL